MIVDGKKIAEEILQELEKERASLPPVLRLGVVMGAGDAASDSFVRIKERTAERLRVDVSHEVLAKDSSTFQGSRGYHCTVAPTPPDYYSASTCRTTSRAGR